MTTTPPEAPAPAGGEERPDEGPRVTRDDVRDLGRLRRSVHDRKVAGVAGGLARHLDVDPLVLRVAFVVLAFFGGAGLLVYGACWLLVPEEGSDEAPVTLDERSRTVALLVVGVLAVVALVGDSWGVFWFPWPLAIIALVALVILGRRDRRHAPPPGSVGVPYVPGHDAPAPTAGTALTYGTGHGTGHAYGQQQTGWVGQQGPVAPAYVAPPRPRKRGPVLFWATLALIALGCGILGLVDVAGVDVADGGYVALGLAIVGGMLVLGSFWGRPGGLILLGVVGALALAVATAADNVDTERVRVTPTSAEQVDDVYELGNGDLLLDLTDVEDLESLDDRELTVRGGIGELQVVVPDGIDLRIDAEVGGPGSVEFFGEQTGGFSTTVVRSRDDGDIDLGIVAELGIGEITFREE